MGIIDRYIIRKYLGTFGFILLLLSVVVLIIDVQAKKPRIQDNGFELSHFLINYYPFWIIYLVMTFMSILVFISVIFHFPNGQQHGNCSHHQQWSQFSQICKTLSDHFTFHCNSFFAH